MNILVRNVTYFHSRILQIQSYIYSIIYIYIVSVEIIFIPLKRDINYHTNFITKHLDTLIPLIRNLDTYIFRYLNSSQIQIGKIIIQRFHEKKKNHLNVKENNSLQKLLESHNFFKLVYKTPNSAHATKKRFGPLL